MGAALHDSGFEPVGTAERSYGSAAKCHTLPVIPYDAVSDVINHYSHYSATAISEMSAATHNRKSYTIKLKLAMF